MDDNHAPVPGATVAYGILPPSRASSAPATTTTADEWLTRLSAFSVPARWALGGGVAVLLGTLLPWISSRGFLAVYEVSAGAKVLSVLLALTLIGAAIAGSMEAYQRPAVRVGIVIAGLGVLAYGCFIVAGWVGVNTDLGLGFQVKTHWDPNVGLILCFGGAIAALAGNYFSYPRSGPSSAGR
jgi:hypothetical protein